jgi:hypothetical protein
MPQLRSKLTPEEKNPEQLKIPERVQKIIDIYDKNHVEYPWKEEDRIEQIFEYRRSQKPDSYKYRITAIYRGIDARREKEYYFYAKKGKVINDNGVVEDGPTLTYGYAVEEQTEVRFEPRVNAKVPVKIRENPVYFFKWDPVEVKKLLDGSEEPCTEFTIGTIGTTGQGDIMLKDVKAIRNEREFLEGSFDDLIVLSDSGQTSRAGDGSLKLVQEARQELQSKSKEKIKAKL